MQKSHFIDVIYTHTEGEPTCIIHAGIPYPAGLDIIAKRKFLQENYDFVRTSLMREPRGHQDMFGVFLTPPHETDADGGMLWVDGERMRDLRHESNVHRRRLQLRRRFLQRVLRRRRDLRGVRQPVPQ